MSEFGGVVAVRRESRHGRVVRRPVPHRLLAETLLQIEAEDLRRDTDFEKCRREARVVERDFLAVLHVVRRDARQAHARGDVEGEVYVHADEQRVAEAGVVVEVQAEPQVQLGVVGELLRADEVAAERDAGGDDVRAHEVRVGLDEFGVVLPDAAVRVLHEGPELVGRRRAAVHLLERHADGGLELGALAQVIVLDRSGILKVLVDQLARLRVERRALAGRRGRGRRIPRRDRGAQEQGRAEEGAQGQRPAGPRSLLPDEGLLLRRRHEGLLVVHVHCYCSLLFTVLIASFLGGSALLLLSTSAGSAEAQLFGNAVVVPIRFPVSKLCCSLRVPAAAFRRRRLVSALQTDREKIPSSWLARIVI